MVIRPFLLLLFGGDAGITICMASAVDMRRVLFRYIEMQSQFYLV